MVKLKSYNNCAAARRISRTCSRSLSSFFGCSGSGSGVRSSLNSSRASASQLVSGYAGSAASVKSYIPVITFTV